MSRTKDEPSGDGEPSQKYKRPTWLFQVKVEVEEEEEIDEIDYYAMGVSADILREFAERRKIRDGADCEKENDPSSAISFPSAIEQNEQIPIENEHGGDDELPQPVIKVEREAVEDDTTTTDSEQSVGVVDSDLQPQEDNQKKGRPRVTITMRRTQSSNLNPFTSTASTNSFLSSTNWTYRALGKTSTVVQTLLNRQLGHPFFTRSEDTASNLFNETQICRHLVRTRAAEDLGGKSVTPPLLNPKLKQKKKRNLSSDWVQLEFFWPDKTRVGIADNRIWVHVEHGQGTHAQFSEEFYSLQPFNFQFTLVGRINYYLGKLEGIAVVNVRSLSSVPNATYLVSLSHPSHLRAYDLGKRKLSNELELNLEITSPGVKAYTKLEVCDSTAKIFLMATATHKELLKAILILDYPPRWTKVGIIYLDELPLPLKLSIDNGLCYLTQGPLVHLSTWPFLMEKVEQLQSPTGNTPSPSLSVRFEGRLTEMPRLITTFHPHNGWFGLQTAGLPVIYTGIKNGIKFFLPVPQGLQSPIYEYQNEQGYQGEEIVQVFPFPDHSPRALLFTQLSGEYEVVQFSVRETVHNKVLESKITHPFSRSDEVKVKSERVEDVTTAVEQHSEGRSSRPRRACVKKNAKVLPNPRKMSILGITHCQILALLAVLYSNDEEFFVILYDSFTLSVFKMLPPVHAWPADKRGDPNKKRDSIEKVEFCFEMDFIFVCIEYSQECRSSKQVFFFRLMSES